MNFKFSKTWRVVKEISTTLGIMAMCLVVAALASLVMSSAFVAFIIPWIIIYGVIKFFLGDSMSEVGAFVAETLVSMIKFFVVTFGVITGVIAIFHAMSEGVKNIRSILAPPER